MYRTGVLVQAASRVPDSGGLRGPPYVSKDFGLSLTVHKRRTTGGEVKV